jgi:hypothetical protein
LDMKFRWEKQEGNSEFWRGNLLKRDHLYD